MGLALFIQYCYNNVEQKTMLDTGIMIPVRCWDKEALVITKDLPAPFGSPLKLNEALQAQMRLVEDVITFAVKRNVPDRVRFVKEYYSPDLDIYAPGEAIQKKELLRKEKVD
jgi:hypothetical protein